MRRLASLFILTFSTFAVAPALSNQPGEDSLKPLPTAQWNRAAAAHLLRRAGFGGSPDEIDALTALGLEAAVDFLLDYRSRPFTVAPPLLDDIVHEDPRLVERRGMSAQERRAYQQRRQRAERAGHAEIRFWWLESMATTPRPLEEKMTLFWHGHLTSGAREVRRCVFMLEQNDFFRRHALGDFHELVLGVSKDRAMLVYLDNVRNVKAAPNENYARELLELFTLGEGAYREADIRAAARAFTGWSFDRDGFTFRRRQHDFGVKEFLGRRGPLDGGDIIEVILEQPACSRFLATKLLQFYVRPDPPRRLVERLAAQIRREDYWLKPVMRALFLSRAFYHPDARGALVKSPVELVIGTARQLGLPVRDLPAAERALATLGQELMQPPNVKGWPGDEHWINTATLFQRYNIVGKLLEGDEKRNRDEKPAMQAGNDDEAAVAAALAAVSRRGRESQPPYDPLPTLRARNLSTAPAIVDFYISHLLARPLAEDKRTALITYLGGDRFTLSDKDAAARVRTMLHLLCSTPEFQMN